MTPLLSILIPTVKVRKSCLNVLLSTIREQTNLDRGMYFEKDGYVFDGEFDRGGSVEVIWLTDNKELTIGEKRERLYNAANGLYSWQIDDDDSLSPDAIKYILEAIEFGKDAITFQEQCWINGVYLTSNHSLVYDDWVDNADGFDFVRTPFMKSVIKTEIACSVPIPHIRFGEDHEWAKALKPHLKSEIHIDKELYIYQHNSKPEDFNSRYGIK